MVKDRRGIDIGLKNVRFLHTCNKLQSFLRQTAGHITAVSIAYTVRLSDQATSQTHVVTLYNCFKRETYHV